MEHCLVLSLGPKLHVERWSYQMVKSFDDTFSRFATGAFVSLRLWCSASSVTVAVNTGCGFKIPQQKNCDLSEMRECCRATFCSLVQQVIVRKSRDCFTLSSRRMFELRERILQLKNIDVVKVPSSGRLDCDVRLRMTSNFMFACKQRIFVNLKSCL